MSFASAKWSQVVALYFTARCCLFVFLVPLSTLLAVYLLSKLSCMALVSLSISFAMTRGVRQFIIKSAPTKQDAEDAMKSARIWVPLGIFLTSIFVMRTLAAVTFLNPILTWSPAVSLAVTIRLAVASVLLGLSVVSRFVGPQSVVRCSSSPLFMNPFARYLRQEFSVAAILTRFASPSDLSVQPQRDRTRQPDIAPPPTHLPNQGRKPSPRRLQQPTAVAMCAQVIISAAIAAVVACTSTVPLTPAETHGDLKPQPYLITCSIVGTFLQLIPTSLDGTSHELNPQRYRRSFAWRYLRFSIQQRYLSFASTLIFIPAVAVYAAVSWDQILVCGSTILVTILYLHVFDFALRSVLCTTPPDMKQLVETASDEVSMDVFLVVVIESLLHSNDDLVKQIIETPSSSVMNALEREEQVRNEAAMKEMANTLLFRTMGDEMGPRLELDILRLAILDSVGGGVIESHNSVHYPHAVRNMNPWINEFSSKQNLDNVPRSEPYTVPLLRSLCAYAGGLGNALILIAETKDPISGDWLLPPGALVGAEYAIRGATRFVLWSLSDSEVSPMSWRRTHLATLVPVLLNSTCRLKTGLLRYAEWLRGRNTGQEFDTTEFFQTENPQLVPLYNTCHDCAKLVLDKVQSSGRSRREELNSIDVACQKWIKDSFTDPSQQHISWSQ